MPKATDTAKAGIGAGIGCFPPTPPAESILKGDLPKPTVETDQNQPLDEITLKQAGKVVATIKGVAPGPTAATEVKAGTLTNPKEIPLFEGKVRAYGLIRSNDGMWLAVGYTIEGNVITEIRTKEPDMKAILAAQITDALALDMPLFNDEEAPRE